MPPMMQRLSGSMVAVVLCFQAASPAGVKGSFSPGRSLAMFPPGTVSFVPLQNPLKSGWPSAVLGAGADAAIASTAMLANPKPIRKMTLPMICTLLVFNYAISIQYRIIEQEIFCAEDKILWTVCGRRFFGGRPRACSSLLRSRVRREPVDTDHRHDYTNRLDQSPLL